MTPQAHPELTDSLREELGLYAFGMLESESAAQIAQHLETGCAVCTEELQAVTGLVVALSSAVDVVAPAPDLKDRLLARVRTEKPSVEQPESGIYVVRGGQGKWKETPWKGITYLRLYYDRTTGFATSLLRVEPGSQYPAHRHRGVEQSWVVEGSCRIGSVTIRAGDYACAAAGTEHGVLVSDDGCLLLMVSSAKDEVLA
jgi:anti-sigma factor ChrR (cupin superfamily)